MKNLVLPVSQAQIILDAFRTLKHAPLVYVEKPTLSLPPDVLEGMLQRIRDAKAVLVREVRPRSQSDFLELRKKELVIPFDAPECAEIVNILETMLIEAEPAPADIRVQVGDLAEIRCLINELRLHRGETEKGDTAPSGV